MAALLEAIIGIFVAFLEALPWILEGLLYMLAATLTIIAYAVSPRYRQKKRKEWADKPAKKYLDLGISSVCLVSLISLCVWLFWPTPEATGDPVAIEIEEGGRGEDVRVRLQASGTNTNTRDTVVAVKEGGTMKILQTTTLEDLNRAIRENVTIIESEDTLQPDAAHEPPPAAAVRESSENMNTNRQGVAPADGGGR